MRLGLSLGNAPKSKPSSFFPLLERRPLYAHGGHRRWPSFQFVLEDEVEELQGADLTV